MCYYTKAAEVEEGPGWWRSVEAESRESQAAVASPGHLS